jgi:hypothetical protein
METYVFSPDWRAIPDFYYWTKLLLNDALIIGVPNVAFQYRRHGGSGTAAERRALRMFEEESRLYDLVSAAAKAKNWTSSARAAERKRMLKLRTMYFAVHDVAALRPRAALDKFRLLLSF